MEIVDLSFLAHQAAVLSSFLMDFHNAEEMLFEKHPSFPSPSPTRAEGL